MHTRSTACLCKKCRRRRELNAGIKSRSAQSPGDRPSGGPRDPQLRQLRVGALVVLLRRWPVLSRASRSLDELLADVSDLLRLYEIDVLALPESGKRK